MKYKLYIVFLTIVGAGAIALFFASSGYYPIAVVGGRVITAKAFAKDYLMAEMYYKNVLKSAVGSSTAAELTEEQIQQSVLYMLIENELVDIGAQKEVGGSVDDLVNKKIGEVATEPGIEKEIEAVYGVGFNDFKSEILVPQAKRDILTGNLLLKGKKIEDWLAEAKKSSKVIIFSGKFYWDGKNVSVR